MKPSWLALQRIIKELGFDPTKYGFRLDVVSHGFNSQQLPTPQITFIVLNDSSDVWLCYVEIPKNSLKTNYIESSSIVQYKKAWHSKLGRLYFK